MEEVKLVAVPPMCLNTLSSPPVFSEDIIAEVADKRAIASAFGRAATTYDKHAQFQRDVGDHLLSLISEDLTGKRVLDLGCGTGYMAEQMRKMGATVVCADLSEEMLMQAKLRCGEVGVEYQQADADALPFADNSFDMVFSSLVLQWCEDVSKPLTEIKRVLNKNGVAYFSTLLHGSLDELRLAWSKVDSDQHVNRFITLKQLKIALAQINCKKFFINLRHITFWYDSAFSAMRDLKGIGANHVSGRSRGLTSRQTLLAVEREYQTFQNHHGQLPVSYQVCFGVFHQ